MDSNVFPMDRKQPGLGGYGKNHNPDYDIEIINHHYSLICIQSVHM